LCTFGLKAMTAPRLRASIWLCCILIASCSAPSPSPSPSPADSANNTIHFTSLPASRTGIGFENTITESDSVNLFIHEYTYMGSGIGIGDFNNDGLPDIFFASAQGSSKLYLNKGHMNCEDITRSAGVSTHAWCTGVSVVDINHDGWPDIYVCVSGIVPGAQRKNLLFINQHDLTFREEAEAYGLADTSFCTQASFFDYDKDGNLDMYLLNHNLRGEKTNDVRDRITDGSSLSADKLYRNQGTPKGMDHPVFKDVSKQAGILEDGYGLGMVVSDLNGDGYPDIYVANDYIRNDVLWMNNGNGTFTNIIASALRHQSYSSMGADAADYNNDGLPDIASLDMQPETNRRKKMMYSFLNYDRYEAERAKGYQPEFMRNMLQLNNGTRPSTQHKPPAPQPFFSEIGQMAGVSETDWSWSVLMADFDNDGWKDMHITNGMGRDLINADFVEYKFNTLGNAAGAANGNNAPNAAGVPLSVPNPATLRKDFVDRLSSMGSVPMRHYLYKNTGDLRFEDVSESAGLTDRSISNGAVYVDLDNDGDLDIVTNNINGPATVLQNDTYPAGAPSAGGRSPFASSSNKYLTLRLKGDSLNRDGIGAIVYAYSAGSLQMVEQYPVRGYLSSMDNRLHFGLGKNAVDSLQVIWPDGKMQSIAHPALNRIMELRYSDAKPRNYLQQLRQRLFQPVAHPIFTDITAQTGAAFRHRESFFNDYAFQPLIPQKYSQEGPFISTGDINGDGLEDFFIGGAYKQPGKIFLQQPDGTFKGKDLVRGTKNEEDMQSVLFDAGKKEHPDLLIASGSSEFDPNSSYYRPRLYRNDGKGNFAWDSTAFPPDMVTTARAVAAADYDGDGFTDVFIGGRVTLGRYPESPRSFLLRNDHGRFVDVTATVCPALRNPGLITAAIWADIDQDGLPELILAGEWMSLRIFKYHNNILEEITETSGLKPLTGLWRSLCVADVDHDGDLDIIAGNMGLNQPFHISRQRPARLYAGDFDGNGIIDPIFCYYIKDETGQYQLHPGINRDQWARQLPAIKKQFDHNEGFANATMEELLPGTTIDNAKTQSLQCNEPRSGWFENDGKGHFVFHPFPLAAQIAPVNALLADDFDHDGKMDILLAGNEYQYNIVIGRMDASYGLLLKGDGKGGFLPLSARQSGLALDGDVRDLKTIRGKNGARLVLVAVNDSAMRILRVN
jgi:hypothetical protein